MAGHNNWPYIVNLGNSIIGVAVLAMPFCFKQCGILLGMIVLLFCTWLTLTSCQLLMRAGIHSRRRSYEFLAYHTHGATGKLLSELGMIGMQIGTLIAQIVVIGDLGPAIFSKFLGLENTSGLRTFLILTLCLCLGLPLGLLKDLRAVSRASTVCISFYCIFILYVIVLSIPNMVTGEWYHKVSFWRPEGFFQCLPILSFSFGCQTQLFLLYDALPDPSLKAISGVISSAVNLCAVAYLLVGFFGYVAFFNVGVPGDVISVFPNTFAADLMKICFVFSIVITFPVIIFPCRSSIYTLMFAKLHVDDMEEHGQKSKAHDDVLDGDNFLPENLFKGITIFIVISCMILGILIPNVEFILGINGAIMGTLICYIFPAMFFLKAMGSKHDSRGMAKIVFVLGVTILLLSTFATLSSQGHESNHPALVQPNNLAQLPVLPRDVDNLQRPAGDQGDVPEQLIKPLPDEQPGDLPKKSDETDEEKADIRQEPPNPDPPDVKPAGEQKPKNPDKEKEAEKEEAPKKDTAVVIENDTGKKDVKEVAKDSKDVEEVAKAADANKAKELELQEKEKKQDELLHQLEKHREEQEKLLEEHRQLLKEFKDHHDKDLKNEQGQEKEKLQEQVKQDGGEPAAAQGGNLQHEQQGNGEVNLRQGDSQNLRQKQQQLPADQQQQLPADQQQQQQPGLHQQQNLLQDGQQQVQRRPQDEHRNRNPDGGLPPVHVKDDVPIGKGVGDLPSDSELKNHLLPDKQQQFDAQAVENVALQQQENDGVGRANIEAVKDIDQAQRPDVPLDGRHGDQLAEAGRVKRSLDVDVKPEKNAGSYEKDKDMDAIAKKAVHEDPQANGADIVKMNVETVAEDGGSLKNHGGNKLHNSQHSGIDASKKGSPVADKEMENGSNKKMNEEMRRKLKSLTLNEHSDSQNGEFVQSLSNGLKDMGVRHLLQEPSRD